MSNEIDPILNHKLSNQNQPKVATNSGKKLLALAGIVFLIIVGWMIYQQFFGNGYKDKIKKQNISKLMDYLDQYKINHNGKNPPNYVKAWKKEFIDSDYIKSEIVNPDNSQKYEYEVTINKHLVIDDIITKNDNTIYISVDSQCDNEGEVVKSSGLISFRVLLSNNQVYCLSR